MTRPATSAAATRAGGRTNPPYAAAFVFDSAAVRKFMVGFELPGMPRRDVTPEPGRAHFARAARAALHGLRISD